MMQFTIRCIKPETLVGDHIYASDHQSLERHGDHGSQIDVETVINIVLETLSDTFDSFNLNFSVNNLEYTVNKLRKEFQTVKGLVKIKKSQLEESVGAYKVSTCRTKDSLNKAKNPSQRGQEIHQGKKGCKS